MDQNQKSLREHLLYLLKDGGAHINFDDVVNDFPLAAINRLFEKIPYTPWQVLEHMRIAQWGIAEFSRNAQHVSPKWPAGYWPDKAIIADEKRWRASAYAFRADLKAMIDLIESDATDLYAPIPHGKGQTILREALLVADHNAYHLGVLSTMKRMV